MTGLAILLLLLGPSPDEALKRADELANQARAAEGEQRKRKVEAALEAYDKVIALRPKDRKLMPRVRKRRATLLKREGRVREALKEYELIYTGRARRKDRARALYDSGALHEKNGRPETAERFFARACDEYPDVTHVRAKASLGRGRVLERLDRPREAERAYRYVVERCRDEAKIAIDAYDRLALLAIAQGDPQRARRWLTECVRRYEKRASRGDRYGAFLSRLLGDMRAPLELTEALARKEAEPNPRNR